MDKKIVTVNSRKFDYQIYRTWQCVLLEQTDNRLMLLGEFEKEVSHQSLGVIRRGTVSYEYFWFKKYFNVFRFHEPDGEFRNFYCNINLPPKFENNILDYVDLDIDVLIWRDFSFEILDIEDFEKDAEKFSYPFDLREIVKKTISELIEKIEKRNFPFDYQL